MKMMKKYFFLITMALILQACLPGVFASREPSTETPTSAPTETRTPIPTITITPSPTIIRLPTQDPDQPTVTPIPVPLFTGLISPTPALGPIPMDASRPGPGFSWIRLSESRIYWGVCKPNSTVITTLVEDPKEVVSVVIFVRLKAAERDSYTPWTTGDVMFNRRDGSFTYLLRASVIEGRTHYRNAWVMFQMVATDKFGNEIGRTRVYEQSIALGPCMCLDMTRPCPPTPKP
jgi:hypothetical protein